LLGINPSSELGAFRGGEQIQVYFHDGNLTEML
jgi:hypothetical protein